MDDHLVDVHSAPFSLGICIQILDSLQDGIEIGWVKEVLIRRHGSIFQGVKNQSTAQFRFKPSGLRRHDFTAVGNIDELLHRNRVQSEGNFHFSAVHAAFQFTEAAKTAHKVDPFVCPKILDAKNRFQDLFLQDGNVQYTDRVSVIVRSGFGGEFIPLSVEVHAEFVESRRTVRRGTDRFDQE